MYFIVCTSVLCMIVKAKKKRKIDISKNRKTGRFLGEKTKTKIGKKKKQNLSRRLALTS